MARALFLASLTWRLVASAAEQPSGGDPEVQTVPEGDRAPVFTPPQLEQDSPAPYPPALHEKPIAGDVELELTLDLLGQVERAQVVGPLHPLLDEAALHASLSLLFLPAKQDGEPVAARVRFRYRFVAPAPLPPPVERSAQISGQILQRGTRRPVALATIRVDGEGSTETDAEGHFTLALLPGRHRFEVAAAGHFPAGFDENLRKRERLQVLYRLEPFTSNPYETVVQGERQREVVTRITLREAELHDVPGTMGDPFRVIMLLPGVGSLVSGISYPVVRGSQPAATGYFIDGVRVPILFHLFLGPAVIHPDFIDGLDFYPGAPPTSYGRLLAGAVEGHLTRPREKGIRGSVYLDILNAGGFLEVPIPQSGTQISLAGRYSYSGLLLSVVNLGLGVKPVLGFADYQARIEQKVGRGKLRLFAFGSFDRVGVDATAPGLPSYLQTIDFHRIDLRYQLPVGNGVFEAGATAGWEQLGARGNNQTAGDVSLGISDRTLGVRAAFSQRFLPQLELKTGGDFIHRAAQLVGTSSQGFGPIPGSITAPVANGYLTGLFAELVWRPSPRWTIAPGLRFDTYHYIPDVHIPAVEPRLTARWDVTDTVTLKAGGGLYHMAPAALITLPVQDVAGLRLGLQEGIQTDIGVEWRPLQALEIVVDAYFNPLPRVVELDPASALLNAVGNLLPRGAPSLDDLATHGRSYGAEIRIRHPLGNRWFGWVSYSFNRSERWGRFSRYDDYGELISTPFGYLPYAFEQQHIFNATVSYQVGAGWTLGATLHFHTGRPETGIFTSRAQRPGLARSDSGGPDTAAWILEDADRAPRLAPFFRADLRVSKTWTLDTFTLEAYLDFQNVAFRPEVLGLAYTTAPSPSGTTLIKSPLSLTLPLPILGVKARF